MQTGVTQCVEGRPTAPKGAQLVRLACEEQVISENALNVRRFLPTFAQKIKPFCGAVFSLSRQAVFVLCTASDVLTCRPSLQTPQPVASRSRTGQISRKKPPEGGLYCFCYSCPKYTLLEGNTASQVACMPRRRSTFSSAWEGIAVRCA